MMDRSQVSPQRLREEDSADSKNLTVHDLREQFDREKSKCGFFDKSYKVFENLAALAEELEKKNDLLENEMDEGIKMLSLLKIEGNKLQDTIKEIEEDKLLFMKERCNLEEKVNKSEDELRLAKEKIIDLEREKDKMLEVGLELESQKKELEDKLDKSKQSIDKLENKNNILKTNQHKNNLDRKELHERVGNLEAQILQKETERTEFDEKMQRTIFKLDTRINEKEVEKTNADIKIVRLEAENDLMKIENKSMEDKIIKLEISEGKLKNKLDEQQKSLDKLYELSHKQVINVETEATEDTHEYIEEAEKKMLGVLDDGQDPGRKNTAGDNCESGPQPLLITAKTTPEFAIGESRPQPPHINTKTKSRIIKSPRRSSRLN